eukprot:gb/GECG01015677.1/.p1 GENE.gb/GECG01015677.1/~~gb/GECG01015677.1/.p1  ORF type:complete len:190 (+),score=39.48 gb/GECG01015677.1/:1-570(+)
MLNVTAPPPPFYRLYRENSICPAPPQFDKVDLDAVRRSTAFLPDEPETQEKDEKEDHTELDETKLRQRIDSTLDKMLASTSDDEYVNGVKELDSILLELPSKVKARRRADIDTELARLLKCYEKNIAEFSNTEPRIDDSEENVPIAEEEDTEMSTESGYADARAVSSRMHGKQIQERLKAIYQRADCSS